MSDSEFTKRKLGWLERVVCDPSLPRSSLAVAGILALKYFNGEEGGLAWPSQRTLAEDFRPSVTARSRRAP